MITSLPDELISLILIKMVNKDGPLAYTPPNMSFREVCKLFRDVYDDMFSKYYLPIMYVDVNSCCISYSYNLLSRFTQKIARTAPMSTLKLTDEGWRRPTMLYCYVLHTRPIMLKFPCYSPDHSKAIPPPLQDMTMVVNSDLSCHSTRIAYLMTSKDARDLPCPESVNMIARLIQARWLN